MTWTHGFSLILQQIKDRNLQICCFNTAIEQPDIFNGNWASFYNHIVTLYHEPQLWSAFYDVYIILDDQHRKEVIKTLFLRYPETKNMLVETIGVKNMPEQNLIYPDNVENISSNGSKIYLPAFLIRLFSHITFGKMKEN